MATYTTGTKVTYHNNFNFDNCVVCGKDLGATPADVMVDGNDKLIDFNTYTQKSDKGEFVSTLPVGSTCVKKFASEVVA